MAAHGSPLIYRLVLSSKAQDDISQILQWTQEAFGDVGRTRYENLIRAALMDLRTDPARLGVCSRADIGPDVSTYYLASSRKHVITSKQVAKPRHLFLFRLKQDVIEVARLLHESMDFQRHLV